MAKLDGKVALITGAAAGLGEGISTAYAKYGAKLIMVDLSPEVEKTAESIKVTFSFTLLSGEKFEGSYEGSYTDIKQSTTNILTLNGESTRDIKATFYEKTNEGVALYLTPSQISSAVDLNNRLPSSSNSISSIPPTSSVKRTHIIFNSFFISSGSLSKSGLK